MNKGYKCPNCGQFHLSKPATKPPTGIPGPQGPPGKDGRDGTTGPQGPPGRDGTISRDDLVALISEVLDRKLEEFDRRLTAEEKKEIALEVYTGAKSESNPFGKYIGESKGKTKLRINLESLKPKK